LIIGVVVLVAQLSLKHVYRVDVTANSRHSLTDTTTKLLSQLNNTVSIKAFVSPDNQYHPAIAELLNRYKDHSDLLETEIVNPDFSPELVREHKIQQQGEMIVQQGNKIEHVFDLSEQSLTNAIVSVSRQTASWLLFVEGHGERSPFNHANFNLSIWAENLKTKGIKLKGINLVETPQIPQNTTALVIASPEREWLDGEVELVKDYVNRGGNLVWLAEPTRIHSLDALSELLNIEFVQGTVIDPNAELLGITNPENALITNYANHPIGSATSGVTLFPQAMAIQSIDNDTWQYTELLLTSDNAWSDVKPRENQSQFDPTEDTPGPLVLSYLIENKADSFSSDTNQRIAVIGDGDFLSNTFIGNGSNLELAMAMVNWVIGDDTLIAIPTKVTLDNTLSLTPTQSLVIGLGFLLFLPILLAAIGFALWWYRRRQ
jgi:ABC-type uncharacterized transport system involved in gliding motility auxiliary subunit